MEQKFNFNSISQENIKKLINIILSPGLGIFIGPDPVHIKQFFSSFLKNLQENLKVISVENNINFQDPFLTQIPFPVNEPEKIEALFNSLKGSASDIIFIENGINSTFYDYSIKMAMLKFNIITSFNFSTINELIQYLTNKRFNSNSILSENIKFIVNIRKISDNSKDFFLNIFIPDKKFKKYLQEDNITKCYDCIKITMADVFSFYHKSNVITLDEYKKLLF